jgi:hypothetical protein
METIIASTVLTSVFTPTIMVWFSAIAAALIVPRYAIQHRVPWPVLAVMIMALMVTATLTTLMLVWGFQAG